MAHLGWVDHILFGISISWSIVNRAASENDVPELFEFVDCSAAAHFNLWMCGWNLDSDKNDPGKDQ